MPMDAMRHLGAFLILLLLPSVVAAGQIVRCTEKEKEPTTERVKLSFAQKLADDWTTAVRAHTAGTIDEPVKTIASWPSGCFTLVLGLVSRTPNAARTLTLGLSLHTDIAIAEFYWPPDRPDAVILVDDQVTGYVGRSAHWRIAQLIAADLAARPGEGPRVAAWYRATAALMQQWRALDLQGMHLEAGQKLFLDDPVLALYQGTLRQAFGDPRLHDYLRTLGSTEGLGKPPLASRHGASIESSNATWVELGVAKRELRRALTLDPTLHEARIRLAHVLSRLGDDREAVEAVRPALEAPLPPFSEFYAALILGRSEEQLGRFDEAGVAYARAAARFPGAQSAEIGRSRVALAQGQAADALKILFDVVGPDATGQADPWRSYYRQHDPDADTLLEAWRGGVK